MKEIRCDHCKILLANNTPRIKSTVNKLSNEVGSHIRTIVWDTMDFCSVNCLSIFILNKERSNEN